MQLDQVIKKNSVWSPDSWRTFRVAQQPPYKDSSQLEEVEQRLKAESGLVCPSDIDRLRSELRAASRGERFILQAGDCAERFCDTNSRAITSKLKILFQMSAILGFGSRRPVTRIGRIAGQFAKPRSTPYERIDGIEMPNFFGENVNTPQQNPQNRQPDPERLWLGYCMAQRTIGYIGQLTGQNSTNDTSGMALEHQASHKEIIQSLTSAVSWVDRLFGQDTQVPMYTSHEGLLLNFEEALTRFSPEHGAYYNLSAHTLWIGDRTRQLDGAHIEYFRGVANPIGVKVGPSSCPREIAEIVSRLNPGREHGRLTMITRFGAKNVENMLPNLVKAVSATDIPVLWSCDPMHGNTETTASGIKTRRFEIVTEDIRRTESVHRRLGSRLSGVHAELTGDAVTECLGGLQGISPADLPTAYESYCDPRLNYSQSLELAYLLAGMIGEKRRHTTRKPYSYESAGTMPSNHLTCRSPLN